MARGNRECIWEGRIHLGDEPGVYGDAAYAGLAVELPITLHRLTHHLDAADAIELKLEAQDVRTYEGYDGHLVTVIGYFADPEREPEWQSKILATTRLTEDTVTLRVQVDGALPDEVSMRVQVDTDVGPGLYDDFVLRRLSIRSQTRYASLGFRFES